MNQIRFFLPDRGAEPSTEISSKGIIDLEKTKYIPHLVFFFQDIHFPRIICTSHNSSMLKLVYITNIGWCKSGVVRSGVPSSGVACSQLSVVLKNQTYDN